MKEFMDGMAAIENPLDTKGGTIQHTKTMIIAVRIFILCASLPWFFMVDGLPGSGSSGGQASPG
jgi:hypothetical protein